MKITFIGAAHQVTGSCHFIEACGKRILIDCGMEQGEDFYENQKLPAQPEKIDYILLTHAHIDHSGLLPFIYSRGFHGEIFTTKASTDLCDIMLKDSAHIQMFEAEWKNRKAMRSGGEEIQPLYKMEDAEGVLKLFHSCEYYQIVELCQGLKVRFSDVGHLLGSASIELWMEENEEKKKIVFSGDIGNLHQPIIKDPHYIKEGDYVVMESTYGDRVHGEKPDYVKDLTEVIQRTFDRGGNLVIPSFAVGRTQEMLYFLRKIKADRLVRGHEDFEVYVDSPLAIEATTVFNENMAACFDEEAMELIRKGVNPIGFPGLKLSVTSEDSKAINFDLKPKVILSASGMCEAGRIRHHLKHNLWRKECSILFVGYQAGGTLGRSLLEGASTVKLFGETIEVCADIVRLDAISGHADKEGLIRWIRAFEKKPERVFIVHGEDTVCDLFAQCLKEEYHFDAVAPYTGTSYDLAENVCVAEGVKEKRATLKPIKRHASTIFERLMNAGRRLLQVISHNESGTNKDLVKFTDQINALCDKWDR